MFSGGDQAAASVDVSTALRNVKSRRPTSSIILIAACVIGGVGPLRARTSDRP
jgi:hypothetical protein